MANNKAPVDYCIEDMLYWKAKADELAAELERWREMQKQVDELAKAGYGFDIAIDGDARVQAAMISGATRIYRSHDDELPEAIQAVYDKIKGGE